MLHIYVYVYIITCIREERREEKRMGEVVVRLVTFKGREVRRVLCKGYTSSHISKVAIHSTVLLSSNLV